MASNLFKDYLEAPLKKATNSPLDMSQVPTGNTSPVVPTPVANPVISYPRNNTSVNNPTVKIASVPQEASPVSTGLGTDETPLGQAPTGMYIDSQGKLQIKGTGEQAITPEKPTTGNYLDDLYTKYGIEKTKSPTLPETPDTVSQYGFDAKAINDWLSQEKNAISEKYNLKKQEAAKTAENRKQSSLSNLYAAGEVNPLSSSFGNVESSVQNQYKEDLSTLDAQQRAEESAAVDRAFGLKTTGMSAANTLASNKLAKTQQDFTNEQDVIKNNLQNIQNAVNVVRSNKQLSTDEKDNTKKSIIDLVNTFGAESLQGINEGELEAMSKAAGWPTGSLTKGLKTLKELQILGKSNIKEVDGSLYNVTTDKNGNIKLDKILQGSSIKEASNYKEEMALRKEYNALPIVKDFNDITKSYQGILGAYNQAISQGNTKSKNAADQIMVTLFNKMIDPTSVVREGEYARTAAGQAVLSRLQGAAERVVQGGSGLTNEERANIVAATQKLYEDTRKVKENTDSQYQSYASDYGFDPSRIVGTSYEVGGSSNLEDVGWEDVV